MRVLIVKLSSLGDVVHTMAALNALRRGFSKSAGSVEIDWLVEEAASGIITGHPMLDEVIVVKKDGWINSPSENFRTARRLAKKHYDIVIDFQGLLKSGVWIWLTKGKRRIGFSNAREMSHLFLNEKLPAYDPEMHAVDRYLLLARHALGGEYVGGVDFVLGIDGAAKERVCEKLRGLGVADDFVVLLPGARWKTKLWTAEGFAAVARAIKERLSLNCVLAGSRDDTALSDETAKLSGNAALSLAGQTTLKELSALLSLARFVVCVDSGPMHIAAAVGTPVFALFGATEPGRTGPYGKGHVIIKEELDCSPCFKRECADPKCMLDITAERVMEAISASSFAPSGKTLVGESLEAGLS